jgi:hypothetical protein
VVASRQGVRSKIDYVYRGPDLTLEGYGVQRLAAAAAQLPKPPPPKKGDPAPSVHILNLTLPNMHFVEGEDAHHDGKKTSACVQLDKGVIGD